MSAADLDSGFTIVNSPRPSGVQRSGLFHHLIRKKNECIAQFIQDGSITSVSRPPPDMLLPGRKYVLLNLDPQLISPNLFNYLPQETKAQYTFGELDLHVTIDQDYGLRGSRLAQEQLFWHSHITLRAAVGNGNYFAFHIYVDQGVIRDICIKPPNGNAYDADDVVVSKAYKLADKPLQILSAAIEHTKAEREKLEAELTEKLVTIFDIEQLNRLSERELCEILESAKELQIEIYRYSDGIYANRFRHATEFVKWWRGRKQTVQQSYEPYSPSPPVEQKFASLSLSESRSHSGSGTLSPTKELLEKEEKGQLDILKTKYEELKRISDNFGKVTLSVDNEFKYYISLKDLRIDTAAAELCASRTHKNYATALASCVKRLPIKEDILDLYVKTLNVNGVKQFFPEMKYKVDMLFFMRFLDQLLRSQMTEQQEDAAIEICEFFFKHDRQFKKCIESSYRPFKGKGKKQIMVLLLIELVLQQRYKLFACLVKYANAQSFEGYIAANNCATSLLTLACKFSISESSNEIITALLDANSPRLENESLFACGREVDIEVEFSLDKMPVAKAEKGEMAQKFALYNEMFEDTLYMGSALYAYVSSGYIDNKILNRLIRGTSTLQLVLSLSRFCMANIDQEVYYSHKKEGINLGANNTIKEQIRLAKLATAFGGAQYFTCIVWKNDRRLHSILEALLLEVKFRLGKQKQDSISEFISILELNIGFFNSSNNHEMSVACYQAILFLSTYLEPTEQNHYNITVALLDLADKVKAQAMIFASALGSSVTRDYVVKCHAQAYVSAMGFADNSTFTKNNRPAFMDKIQALKDARVNAVLSLKGDANAAAATSYLFTM